MTDKLLDIKVEGTSLVVGHVDTSVIACDLPTVKVKVENEDILGAEAGTYDTRIGLNGIKVEIIDSAPDNVTTSCGQSLTTNVCIKEEGAGICFDLVKKIKVEKGLLAEGEDGTNDTGIGMMEVKDEHAYATSRDLTSSSESTSRFTSNSPSVDTSALTKEEDLDLCFEEEEGSAQVSLDFCASFEDREGPTSGDKGHRKTEMYKGADEFGGVVNDSRVHAVSPIVDSVLVISDCVKSDSLKGDPSVLLSGKPFQCTDCTARFKRKWHLKQHAVVHSSERPFACTQCSSKFKCKSDLNKHLTTHSVQRLFHCSHCTSSFKTKKALKAHSHVHSSEKPFICTECPARFALKYDLKKHLAVHSNDRPFLCPHCSSTFKCKSNLNQHLMIHVDEKSFSCAHCTSTFKDKSHLKQHLHIHSNEKPFMCSHCPARFRWRGNLTRHLTVHSNERPFACPHCSSKFKRKSSMNYHMVTHVD